MLQEEPDIPFTEEDYRRRRPHPNFKEHIAVEKLTIKLGKTVLIFITTLLQCEMVFPRTRLSCAAMWWLQVFPMEPEKASSTSFSRSDFITILSVIGRDVRTYVSIPVSMAWRHTCPPSVWRGEQRSTNHPHP